MEIMAHNVESMFSANRVVPWHYELTKDATKLIQEAPTSKDALHLAGLDWEVQQTPVYLNNGIEIPNYKANVRSTDNACLGIVTDRYKIVQNTEAFEFTDAIVGETEDGVVKYETAGSLCGGKKIWLLAKMPTKKVLDDEVDPYMFFSNTHDGSGAIKVGLTPVRIVCANTLAMALNGSKRSWSTKHVGDMQSKLEEAKWCLQMADKYMQSLDEEADRLANARLYKEQIDEILDELYPIDDNDTDRKKRNVQAEKDNFFVAYFMPDIAKFRDTAWGAVNAMSDVVTHATPKRNTASFNENRWGKIMDGHAIFDRFVELVNQKISV
jgi:phage/plasmid-like protein (TIGR03299 family)